MAISLGIYPIFRQTHITMAAASNHIGRMIPADHRRTLWYRCSNLCSSSFLAFFCSLPGELSWFWFGPIGCVDVSDHQLDHQLYSPNLDGKMSENGVYPQWNSHLVGIMIINHWVYGKLMNDPWNLAPQARLLPSGHDALCQARHLQGLFVQELLLQFEKSAAVPWPCCKSHFFHTSNSLLRHPTYHPFVARTVKYS